MNCEGCVYWRNMTSASSMKICHYAIDNGKIRGCSVENCNKYATERTKAYDFASGERKEIKRD